MRLKLRYYRSEGTIRSIGDPPNGVLNIDSRDGKSVFVIDPKMQPKRDLGEHEQRVLLNPTDADRPDFLVAVDVDAVLDAIDNDETRRMLVQFFAAIIEQSARLLLRGPIYLDVVESLVALARETFDAAEARGWAR